MSHAFWQLYASLTQINPSDVGVQRNSITDATIAGGLSATFMVTGGMAVLFILVGAARYSTSNGEQAKITQAKNTIIYAVIGLVLSTLAFAIVQFTLGKIL